MERWLRFGSHEAFPQMIMSRVGNRSEVGDQETSRGAGEEGHDGSGLQGNFWELRKSPPRAESRVTVNSPVPATMN